MVEEIIRKKKGKVVETLERIMVAGKEFRPKFTMPIWIRMEDEICTLDDIYTLMHSKGRFEKNKIPALAELLTGGEITAGEVLESDPATMRAVMDRIEMTIAQAITMREKKYEDDSVHDEVLEEIQKKEPGAD